VPKIKIGQKILEVKQGLLNFLAKSKADVSSLPLIFLKESHEKTRIARERP
jgi:hypothetical protein